MGNIKRVEPRPTIKGLKQSLADYKTSYEAARADVQSLQNRNEELLEMRDFARKDFLEARENAAQWRKHSEGLKKEIEVLEKDRDAYRYNFEAARENLNRCLGWIDSRLDTHPVERYRRREDGAMPAETELTRAEQTRGNTGGFSKPSRDKW